VAWENSSVVAWENSSVVAWENSSVEARGNSSVEARENSSVVALKNSSVEAWENSSVVAWENSSVEARENSSVEARENSSVVARENSSVVAHDFSMITVLVSSVILKKLLDYSVASFRGFSGKVGRKSKTATVIKTPEKIERSFKEWLKQGYVHADGFTKKLISQKKIKDIEVFEVEENFLKHTMSYVVKKGDKFSHGKTIKDAIGDLRYKISNRDTSHFRKWKKNDVKPIDDIIEAYRVITGACSLGTKNFCEGKKLPKALSIAKAIEMTKDQYGSKKFEEFFK
jgi:hypothetical protein